MKTMQQPAINVLKEIQAFLEANPSEIVTLILEDYVQAPNGLTKVFTDAGLMKYWFPVTSMPKNGKIGLLLVIWFPKTKDCSYLLLSSLRNKVKALLTSGVTWSKINVRNFCFNYYNLVLIVL